MSVISRFASFSLPVRIILIVVVLLLVGNMLFSGDDTPPPEEPHGMRVTVLESDAYNTTRQVQLYGMIEATKRVMIRSEVKGTVQEILTQQGQEVEQGNVILRLNPRNLPEAVRHGEALVAQRAAELKAAKSLAKRGYKGDIALEEAEALMASAQAQLKQAKDALEDTVFRAPFEGVVDYIPFKPGDYVREGDQVAAVIDSSQLRAVGYVPENYVRQLTLGATSRVVMPEGLELFGTVSFISHVAEDETRTYRVEVDIPQPKESLPDGMTATLNIPAGEVLVHVVPSSALSLDDAGVVGVKIASAENVVSFVPVQVIAETKEGLEVSGLPEHARIITLGQAFVQPGETIATSAPEPQPSAEGS